MKKIILSDYSGNTFERVSKRTAEKLFNAGVPLRVVYRNISPVNMYGAWWEIEKSEDSETFTRIHSAMTFYNTKLDFYKISREEK